MQAGLHFNIVDGHPPHSAAPRSLLSSDGRFRSSDAQRLAALLGRSRAEDIARELRAQLSILRDRGVRISHLDSHGHLHKFPAVARAIQPVLREFQITKVRRPQNLYRHRSFRDVLDHYCGHRFPHFVTTDYLYALEPGEGDWLLEFLTFLPEGIAELAVHPGRTDAWRRFETEPFFRHGPKVFRDAGVELVSYNDLTR
jgi:chitin disaccharide deacetylase